MIGEHFVHFVEPIFEAVHGFGKLAGVQKALIESAFAIGDGTLQRVPQVVHLLEVLLHNVGIDSGGGALDEALARPVGEVDLLGNGFDNATLEFLEFLLLGLDGFNVSADGSE